LKPLAEADIARFRERREALGLVQPVAHASYLINLASPKDDLWRRSIHALAVELRRAKRLDLIGVVVHPGAFLESAEETGITRVAQGIDAVLALAGPEAAPILLENTAGQGSTLGWRFEQLGRMIDQANRGEEVGVCIDTCHAFAAGYDLRTKAGFNAAFDTLDQCVGLARVKAFHLNDSKKDHQLARGSARAYRPWEDGLGAVSHAAERQAVC
jgi:deoxyribonuclease-4